jgi:hypothetical protein
MQITLTAGEIGRLANGAVWAELGDTVRHKCSGICQLLSRHLPEQLHCCSDVRQGPVLADQMSHRTQCGRSAFKKGDYEQRVVLTQCAILAECAWCSIYLDTFASTHCVCIY